MLDASGPQAGQHGDSRARIRFDGVDSVLRADPRAPLGARTKNRDPPSRRQAPAIGTCVMNDGLGQTPRSTLRRSAHNAIAAEPLIPQWGGLELPRIAR